MLLTEMMLMVFSKSCVLVTDTHLPTSRSKVLCRDGAVKVCSSRAPMSHEVSGSPRFWEPQTPFNPQPPNSPNPKHVRAPPHRRRIEKVCKEQNPFNTSLLCSAKARPPFEGAWLDVTTVEPVQLDLTAGMLHPNLSLQCLLVVFCSCFV